jgi:hypothetical protein
MFYIGNISLKMNQASEKKFLSALDISESLIDFKYRPTNLTYQAIELFCEIAELFQDWMGIDFNTVIDKQKVVKI